MTRKDSLMNQRSRWLSAAIWLTISLSSTVIGWAQARPLPNQDVSAIYQRLLPQIEKIPIVDMHAHPGYWDDSDVDAMAVTVTDLDPLRTRATNPEWAAAAKALFGYPYSDFSPEHAAWLDKKDDELRKEWGKDYFTKILDLVGIQVGVANRVAMDYLQGNPRFRWVVFVDPFMFPFNNHDLAINPDRAVYFPIQEKTLHRYMTQAGASQFPSDLAGYEALVSRVLEQDKQQGAVAIKFEAPYFRSLVNISDPPREKAEAIYAQFHAGDVPSEDEYRTFQDYIFRVLIDQAGKLKLSVHFHSAVGVGDYFSLRNGNPLNLENVLRDPRYSNVNFVLIHGGYPYTLDMIWLTAAKNVYTDSSLMGYYIYPSELKNILKQWISLYPEKIIFGSDAFPFNNAVGAEETFWLAARSARTAVAAALAELVAEGAFNEEKAFELARLYLHDNAAKLYGEKK